MKRKLASESRDIHGVVAAAVTPRRAHEYSIDLAATLELVDFLGEAGCDGILLLGSTGEFVHFALDDRRHMVRFAAKRSRVPLLVNVSHSTLDGAVDLARDAANDGIAGVLILPPYYFTYDQEEIRAFMLHFAHQVDGAVPIYLYNMPGYTNTMELATAVDLLETGNFAGIKDSSGSIEYLAGLPRGDLRIFTGSDALYTEARIGGTVTGVISAVTCAVPELLVAIERAIAAGDFEKARHLHRHVEAYLTWMRRFPLPVVIKEAVSLRRRNMGAAAVPLSPSKSALLEQFLAWFKAWLPEVLAECGR